MSKYMNELNRLKEYRKHVSDPKDKEIIKLRIADLEDIMKKSGELKPNIKVNRKKYPNLTDEEYNELIKLKEELFYASSDEIFYIECLKEKIREIMKKGRG